MSSLKWRGQGACWGLLAISAAVSAPGQTIHTAALNSAPQVHSAIVAFYNMEYGQALAQFEQVAAEQPGNPLATAFVLDVTVFQELNRLDLLDTTFYANDGFLSEKHTVVEDPAAKARIFALGSQVEQEADKALAANPHDVDALYARGWAESLEATYEGIVERSFVSALKLALRAKDDEQAVLNLDPDYVDADLIVGVYQYVVGSLPFTFRMLVGVAGISGSRSKGMQLLQAAAAHGPLSSVEARTCMMLFLRREGKYPAAEALADSTAMEFPHDYLFQLELANLQKDNGEAQRAIGQYQSVLREAEEPGYFHNAHLELAYFGLGDTLRGQKEYGQAAEAYASAASVPTTSPELRQRCQLAAGKTYDLMHEHGRAVPFYQAALAEGSTTAQGEEASHFLRSPYSGN